jgi:dTDP-4-amino-4,6-dideoxygalactose transaminase
MKVPFVDLTAQYATIADEVQEAITAVVKRGDFILGRDVALFEEEYAAYCGAKYAIGLDSGTSALELTLRAFDIGSGHEVITAANTFIAPRSPSLIPARSRCSLISIPTPTT